MRRTAILSVKNMKFVIRDDDLNYFSNPEDIKRWYGDLFKQGISVGFAAIPFVKHESDVYTSLKEFLNKEYPISSNTSLITYIQSEQYIEVLLHGCTHETKNGVFEYEQTSGLLQETKRGKEELEKAFQRSIDVFVPPHDQISNDGIKALDVLRLNLIRGKGSKNLFLNYQYLKITFRMVFYRLGYVLTSRVMMPPYPYTVRGENHQEAFSARIEAGEKILRGWMRAAQKKGGNFVVVCHLHDFTDEKKRVLKNLIAYAHTLNASFVPPSALFETV